MLRFVGEGPWPRQGPLAVTIGNFDGVHLGHQMLLAELKALAAPLGVQTGVVSFEPHPQELFSGGTGRTLRLFDTQHRAEMLGKLGIDIFWLKAFTREFSELSAPEFLQKFISDLGDIRALVVGHDFRFGRGREGDFSYLQSWARDRSVSWKLIQVPALNLENKVVSSTRIRESLLTGDAEDAARLLGQPYYLRGVVVKGDQRGRELGFPTANLEPTVQFLPRSGVYASRVRRPGVPGPSFPSITNIGERPTFKVGGHPGVKIETHIFDQNWNLYGETLEVELHSYVRAEIRFESKAALVDQILEDMGEVRRRHGC